MTLWTYSCHSLCFVDTGKAQLLLKTVCEKPVPITLCYFFVSPSPYYRWEFIKSVLMSLCDLASLDLMFSSYSAQASLLRTFTTECLSTSHWNIYSSSHSHLSQMNCKICWCSFYYVDNTQIDRNILQLFSVWRPQHGPCHVSFSCVPIHFQALSAPSPPFFLL